MIKTKVATVFGGTGFIGRAVVQHLAQAGYVVRVPTRDLVKAGRLRTAGGVGQVVPMFCPTRSDDALKAVITGADIVINLIGILYESRFGKFQRVQTELPGKLAAIAAAANVSRFVQLSAIGASANSKSKYARTKAAGEAAVQAAFPSAAILRPSVVFGPEDNFFNQFARMAKTIHILPLIGGGKTLFQPVYVGNVADAVMAAISRTDTAGKVYELGGPEALSFKQLMEKTLEWSGQKACLISLPFCVAKVKATFLGLLPKPPLTRDQVELLKFDNILSKDALTLSHLGIKPTAMSSIVPEYLSRLRPGGRFAKAS